MREYTKKDLRELRRKSFGGIYGFKSLSTVGPDVEEELWDLNNYTNEQLEKLERISITYNTLTEIDLEQIRKCKKLKEISIYMTNLKKVDLAPLEGLPIEEITLSDNHIEDIDLQPLEGCVTLKKLFLDCNYIEKIDLKPLEKLEKMVAFSVGLNRHKEIEIEWLSSKKLRSIDISTFNTFENLNLESLYEKRFLQELLYTWREGDGSEAEPFGKNYREVRYTKTEYQYTGELDCKDYLYKKRKYLIDEVLINEKIENDRVLRIKNSVRIKKEKE